MKEQTVKVTVLELLNDTTEVIIHGYNKRRKVMKIDEAIEWHRALSYMLPRVEHGLRAVETVEGNPTEFQLTATPAVIKKLAEIDL